MPGDVRSCIWGAVMLRYRPAGRVQSALARRQAFMVTVPVLRAEQVHDSVKAAESMLVTQAKAATVASRDLALSFDSYFPPLLAALEKTTASDRKLQVRCSYQHPGAGCGCENSEDSVRRRTTMGTNLVPGSPLQRGCARHSNRAMCACGHLNAV